MIGAVLVLSLLVGFLFGWFGRDMFGRPEAPVAEPVPPAPSWDPQVFDGTLPPDEDEEPSEGNVFPLGL